MSYLVFRETDGDAGVNTSTVCVCVCVCVCTHKPLTYYIMRVCSVMHYLFTTFVVNYGSIG